MPAPDLAELKLMKFSVLQEDLPLYNSLMRFSKKDHSDEQLLFLANPKKLKGKAFHDLFIADGGDKQVNLSSDTFRALTENAEDTTGSAYVAALKTAKSEVYTAYKTDIFPRFVKSAEYKTYAGLIAEAEATEAAKKQTVKAAKLLGIKDKDALVAIMVQVKLGNDGEANKLMTKLLKEENIKERAEVVIANLARSGLI